MFNNRPLTAIDIKAIRLADSLMLSVGEDGKQICQLVKRPTDKDKQANPFAQDAHLDLPAGVRIDRNWKQDVTSATAREYISLYRDCHARSVLLTLRVGDIVNFAFHPDYGNTSALEAAGFHVDVIMMTVNRIVKRGGEDCFERVASFELDRCTTNNVWRPVRGIRAIALEA